MPSENSIVYPFYLIGTGGQFRSMLPTILEILKVHNQMAGQKTGVFYDLGGIVVPDNEEPSTPIDAIPTKHDSDLAELVLDEKNMFINCIGHVPGRPPIRKQMFAKMDSLGIRKDRIHSLISPTALLHGGADGGVFVHDLAYIGPYTNIGFGTIINTGAVIEHDVTIGKHCHLAPRSTVLGNIQICDDVIVGAGSVVLNHITEPGYYAGLPARRIPLRNEPHIIVPGRH